MIRLKPDGDGNEPLHVLCLGCHSDDIEIGCGGAVLKLASERPNAIFSWVVFSAKGIRASEAECAARQFVNPCRMNKVIVQGFRDGFMPFAGADVKIFFEELKQNVSPHIIFTHNRRDAHQDHRLVADLTWNTFRNHLILEYEIPKYDGDIGQPNVFMPLSKEICDRKVDLIVDTFRSQANKLWFDRELFKSLMRLRGMECNATTGYAEAFYGRKLLI